MTKFAFFLGCTIPYRIPFVEVALRKTLPEFGIELVDIPFGWPAFANRPDHV